MKEEWKAIPGFRNFYEVSNLGKVRSYLSTRGERTGTPHLLTPTDNGRGYKTVSLSTAPGKTRKEYIHRLVASAWLPNPTMRREVNHLNGDKSDNRFSNLQWATREENQLHRARILKARTVRQFVVDLGAGEFVTDNLSETCERYGLSRTDSTILYAMATASARGWSCKYAD